MDIAVHTTTGLITTLLADSSMDNQWVDFFNGFIVASNGMPFLARGSTIGIIGMTEDAPAFPVLPTDYDGTISLRALVESYQQCYLDIFDGDADRSGIAFAANYPGESNDANTPDDGIATGFPLFAVCRRG